jgi:hypothetical protein
MRERRSRRTDRARPLIGRLDQAPKNCAKCRFVDGLPNPGMRCWRKLRLPPFALHLYIYIHALDASPFPERRRWDD